MSRVCNPYIVPALVAGFTFGTLLLVGEFEPGGWIAWGARLGLGVSAGVPVAWWARARCKRAGRGAK